MRRDQEWNRQAEAEEEREADEFFRSNELDENGGSVPLGETEPADPWDECDASPERRAKKPVDPWRNERLGTVHDVAGYFGVHWKTVEIWRRKDGLPCFRQYGVIRYPFSDVSRWVSARKEGI